MRQEERPKFGWLSGSKLSAARMWACEPKGFDLGIPIWKITALTQSANWPIAADVA